MSKISVAIVVAFTSLCVAYAVAAQNASSVLPDTPISTERLTAHVKILASDLFQGRAPGTPGETMTVDYIVRQLTAIGIGPGGEPDGRGGRRWTQDVPLEQSDIKGAVKATIHTEKGEKALRQGDDIAIRATSLSTEHVSIKNAPLVFVGYGVTAPERQWDDFKGFDLKGKIAIVLVNDPDFETDLGGRFDGKAMTYYGRWRYKFEEAARHGALGLLIVHETDPAAYGWDTVRNSNTASMFDIVRPNPATTHMLLEAWMQHDIAVELFKNVGLNFETEKKKAQSDNFKPVSLADAMISIDYRVKHSRVVSKNVIGRLAGGNHTDESVIYTAHWDHLGVGKPAGKDDRIFNGARDNALGVAALIEIARVYTATSKTDRSVVFMSLTAEEKGLLGSEYYAQHPLYPLEKTAAVFNMDALSTAGPSRDVTVAGDSKVSLQDDWADAARKQSRSFSPDPRPEAGLFFRMDHFNFAKAGVPAISIKSGFDLYIGGIAAGKEAADAYTQKQYHQPTDEWSPDWDLRGIAIDVGLIFQIGRDLATSRRWPEWRSGSEFKAVRDATASARK